MNTFINKYKVLKNKFQKHEQVCDSNVISKLFSSLHTVSLEKPHSQPRNWLCFLFLLVGVLMVVVPRSSEDARGSVDDDNMVEDRALTYDELIQEVMKNENLTETEAKQFIGVSEENSGRATYRIYKASVTVTSTYKV